MIRSKMNILLIIDSLETMDLIAKSIPCGYKRQFALSAENAIEMIKNKVSEPDIILIDIKKGESEDVEFCSRLKNYNEYRDIPILLIKSIDNIHDIESIYEMGGIEYIREPYNIKELIARLEGYLKHSIFERELKSYNNNLLELAEIRTKEIMKSQMATVYALAKLAELRDSYTGSHLERVSSLSGIIAEKYMKKRNEKNINQEYIAVLKQASILHDIGKVGISDNILMKNGPLSSEEFDKIKQHTKIGAMTIKSVFDEFPSNSFLGMAAEIALSHHEKWNGEGYPNGLKGKQIPFSARIVGLVDTYDAIRSKRPYKKEISHEESINIIKKERGISFDPLLVDLFIEAEREIEELYKGSFAICDNNKAYHDSVIFQ